MPKRLWQGFRSWPLWAQITSVGVALIVVVGVLSGGKEETVPARAAPDRRNRPDATVAAATTSRPSTTPATAAPTTIPPPTTVRVAAPPAAQPPATQPPAPGAAPQPPAPSCDANYAGACVPPFPPDVDCADIPVKSFQRIGNDPHRLDTDNDGIACEA